MLTLYLRKRPTRDNFVSKVAPTLLKDKRDVVAYSDAGCGSEVGRWVWYSTSRPTRRNKYVVLNCFRYRSVWA